MAHELDREGLEKLEEKHRIQFKFAVPNAHFTTGLVERRMRFIHDCLGKLDMQGAGISITELTLMFQYVACKLNKIPFGIRNINTYSGHLLDWNSHIEKYKRYYTNRYCFE